MIASNLFDLRMELRGQGVILAYCGYVTEPVLTGVGEALKQKLAIEEMDAKTARSVFAVFVEQMQNIIRYSAEKEPPDGDGPTTPHPEIRYGIVTIGRSGQGFVVRAGNLVTRPDVPRLRAQLERLRQADRAELRSLYKETLKAEPAQSSKGAGVGFIEIARRASQPIGFDFLDVDEHFVFFALEAEI